MWKDAYLESRVLSADPVELIRIVYQHALDSVRVARRHLAAGDIAARSRSISQALAAVAELTASLDHSVGGTISRNLEQLYLYISRRLFEANIQQQDGPLAEVEALLNTLSEAWKPSSEPADERFREVPVPAMGPGPWQEAACGNAHGWSA